MRAAVVYSSRTGNTEKLAEQVRDCLRAYECVYFGRTEEEIKDAELLLVGFWTDKGQPDECAGEFLKKLHGKKLFLFGTAGFGADPEYFGRILKNAEAVIPEDNETVGGFMCQGRMQESVRRRYEAMQAADPGDVRAGRLLENFDRALEHPSGEDFSRLAEQMAGLGL